MRKIGKMANYVNNWKKFVYSVVKRPMGFEKHDKIFKNSQTFKNLKKLQISSILRTKTYSSRKGHEKKYLAENSYQH